MGNLKKKKNRMRMNSMSMKIFGIVGIFFQYHNARGFFIFFISASTLSFRNRKIYKLTVIMIRVIVPMKNELFFFFIFYLLLFY